MRLVMKSGDVIANLRVDAVERVGDVIYAYRNSTPIYANGERISGTEGEFAGMFDLGAVDFIYTTPERDGNNG